MEVSLGVGAVLGAVVLSVESYGDYSILRCLSGQALPCLGDPD